MIAVKNSYTENVMESYWENIANRVCSSFSFTDEERRKFLSNKTARLIGCLPKIADTKTPDRDACSNLAVYIMSIRETKPFYNHQECDDEDIFSRLQDIMNFNCGNRLLYMKGMSILALTMLYDYKRDVDEDAAAGKYNPLNTGAWDYAKLREELLEEYGKIDSYEIDSIVTLSESATLVWEPWGLDI
ncbi:MAG: hypothetical protein HQ557_03925 [Bacteroidetes bacterium]|nr:hypothetical protein [Bacteroidota bacterium]